MSNEFVLYKNDIHYFIRRNEIIKLIHIPLRVIETTTYYGNKVYNEQWFIQTIHEMLELTKEEYDSIYEWLFARDINFD